MFSEEYGIKAQHVTQVIADNLKKLKKITWEKRFAIMTPANWEEN